MLRHKLSNHIGDLQLHAINIKHSLDERSNVNNIQAVQTIIKNLRKAIFIKTLRNSLKSASMQRRRQEECAKVILIAFKQFLSKTKLDKIAEEKKKPALIKPMNKMIDMLKKSFIETNSQNTKRNSCFYKKDTLPLPKRGSVLAKNSSFATIKTANKDTFPLRSHFRRDITPDVNSKSVKTISCFRNKALEHMSGTEIKKSRDMRMRKSPIKQAPIVTIFDNFFRKHRSPRLN